MEVTPATFREVEFREKRRGYHPEDVDEFLEQMATAVDQLHDRVRQAEERAQRAQAVAAEAGSSDETLRRTLVLAQRTAEAAVQDAREQAARIVAGAEQQARSIVGDAEERARRLHGEALADVHAELAKLEAIRAQAQEEVEALSRWASEHRTHLAASLREALAAVERAELRSPAPSSRPVDVPFAAARTQASPVLAPPPPADVAGPPTEATRVDAGRPDPAPAGQPGPAPADAPRPEQARGTNSGPSSETGPQPVVDAGDNQASEGERNPLTEPDEEALDNFFEDGEFAEEPRFGGRLRRRG